MQFGMKYWPNDDGISISKRLRTEWSAGGDVETGAPMSKPLEAED